MTFSALHLPSRVAAPSSRSRATGSSARRSPRPERSPPSGRLEPCRQPLPDNRSLERASAWSSPTAGDARQPWRPLGGISLLATAHRVRGRIIAEPLLDEEIFF